MIRWITQRMQEARTPRRSFLSMPGSREDLGYGSFGKQTVSTKKIATTRYVSQVSVPAAYSTGKTPFTKSMVRFS